LLLAQQCAAAVTPEVSARLWQHARDADSSFGCGMRRQAAAAGMYVCRRVAAWPAYLNVSWHSTAGHVRCACGCGISQTCWLRCCAGCCAGTHCSQQGMCTPDWA
jgi:hypothetical protein